MPCWIRALPLHIEHLAAPPVAAPRAWCVRLTIRSDMSDYSQTAAARSSSRTDSLSSFSPIGGSVCNSVQDSTVSEVGPTSCGLCPATYAPGVTTSLVAGVAAHPAPEDPDGVADPVYVRQAAWCQGGGGSWFLTGRPYRSCSIWAWRAA
jgi:hypothetical protein